MWQRIKNWWKELSTRGAYFPFVSDSSNKGKPSVTILFSYVTFLLACGSLIVSHFKQELLPSTGTAILFWVLSMIFYRIRKLDKVKLDLDDKSIEINSSDKDE